MYSRSMGLTGYYVVVRVRSFGLVPLCVISDIPYFYLLVLKTVLARAYLRLVVNDKSRLPFLLQTSRPYVPSSLLSSSPDPFTLCRVRR